jgi:hypothetical protein
MKIHVILEPDITPDQLVEIGLLAESLGIAGLWVQNYAAGADPFMSLVLRRRLEAQFQHSRSSRVSY